MSTILPDPTILDTPEMFEWVRESNVMHEALLTLFQDAEKRLKMHTQIVINRINLPATTSDPILFTVPVGYRFFLNRILIEIDGFTPANPLISAGQRAFIYRGNINPSANINGIGAVIEFFPNPPGNLTLPILVARDFDEGALFYSGERISFRMGAPIPQVAFVTIQGYLIEEGMFK